MARPLRIEYPGAWYHVTCRGNEKREIFSDDKDRGKFLETLAQSVDLYHVEVHAYVLMDNHFHLILMTPNANLNNFMHRFNTAYTVYYNRRHKRSGHLFQGRYKAILIDVDNYLLELSRYLHLNPLRIKTYSHLDVIKKQKIIRDYPWSSYSGYIDPRNRESFVKYSKVISMVGGKDDREGRKRYKEFVMRRVTEDVNITFWKEVKGQVVLGAEAFSNWVYDRFLSKRSDDGKEVPGLKALRPDLIRMEDIAREVAKEFKVDSEELCRRRSKCRVARSVYMELCRVYLTSKVGLTEIGRRLGGVSVDALSQNSRRLSKKMGDDLDLRQQFQKLAMVLERLSK